MKLIRRLFTWNDRRRARDYLQDVCEERAEMRRKLDEINRKADRALQDALELDFECFREQFFGKRDPVHTGFIGSSAKLFGIESPTQFVVEVPPLKASKYVPLAEAA